MKIKTLWITNLFFFSPVPKARITHQQNWIQTSEVIWFLVNIWYCGWKKRKLENLLKCNLEKKAQIMGKIARVSTTKLKKKKNTVADTSTIVFFLGRIFALCLQKELEIWRFSFFLVQIREKSPQLEEKFAKNKEILKGFRVLTTKLGQKKTLVQTP